LRAFLVAVSLLSAIARAESPAEKEARERYSVAQKAFDEARYQDAAAEFERSYQLSHYPAILHKIALCYDQLAQSAKAIDYYQRYLDAEDRENPRRAGIEARIATLKEQIKPAPPAEPQSQPQPLAPPPPPPRKTPLYKKWWLWTVVGVAAAGLAVGLGVGLAPPSSPTPSSFSPTLTPGTVGPGR
jgi:tetratricopeptide (TPR) repeat protein